MMFLREMNSVYVFISESEIHYNVNVIDVIPYLSKRKNIWKQTCVLTIPSHVHNCMETLLWGK